MRLNILGKDLTLLGPVLMTVNPATLQAPDGIMPDEAFIENVRRFGVIEPVVLLNGTLVGGRRRVLAAREVGLAHIPALGYEAEGVLPDGWLALAGAELTVMLNAARRENPLADFRQIGVMVGRGMSVKDCAAATGLTVAQVSSRLRLGRLPEPLLDALAARKMTAAVADAAAKLPVDKQMRLAAVYAEKGRVTGADVHDVREVQRDAATAGLFDGALDGALNDVQAAAALDLPAVLRNLSSATLERVSHDLRGCADAEKMQAVIRLVDDAAAR